MKRGHLFDGAAAPATGERFEELAKCQNVVFERIVSSAEPEPEIYEQTQDEFVLLMRGEATIELEGEAFALRAGDWLVLPAGRRHRVAATSEGALWLAAHVHPTSE